MWEGEELQIGPAGTLIPLPHTVGDWFPLWQRQLVTQSGFQTCVGRFTLFGPAGSNQSSLVWSISMQVLQAYPTNCPFKLERTQKSRAKQESSRKPQKSIQIKAFYLVKLKMEKGFWPNSFGLACRQKMEALDVFQGFYMALEKAQSLRAEVQKTAFHLPSFGGLHQRGSPLAGKPLLSNWVSAFAR